MKVRGCHVCKKAFREFEFYYVKIRYGRDWLTPERYFHPECRDGQEGN